jgi:hypothetical protein
MPGKRQYGIDTDMLQLQVGGRRGTSSLKILKLQTCLGRDVKEEVAESAQDYNGKRALFQPHNLRAILRGSATQKRIATAAVSGAPQLHRLAPPQWEK